MQESLPPRLGALALSQKLGDWINIYTLLYIEQITSKDLLYSRGNSIQYSMMTYMGRESKKVDTLSYITDKLCSTAETDAAL